LRLPDTVLWATQQSNNWHRLSSANNKEFLMVRPPDGPPEFWCVTMRYRYTSLMVRFSLPHAVTFESAAVHPAVIVRSTDLFERLAPSYFDGKMLDLTMVPVTHLTTNENGLQALLDMGAPSAFALVPLKKPADKKRAHDGAAVAPALADEVDPELVLDDGRADDGAPLEGPDEDAELLVDLREAKAGAEVHEKEFDDKFTRAMEKCWAEGRTDGLGALPDDIALVHGLAKELGLDEEVADKVEVLEACELDRKRAVASWEEGVHATREAFALRCCDDRMAPPESRGQLSLVQHEVDGSMAVDLVRWFDAATLDGHVVGIDKLGRAMNSVCPWQRAEFPPKCFDDAFIIVPRVGIEMHKARDDREHVPPSVARLRTVWQASLRDDANAGKPCVVCHRGEHVVFCTMCLLPWHSRCAAPLRAIEPRIALPPNVPEAFWRGAPDALLCELCKHWLK
jgi:hypothetical protein